MKAISGLSRTELLKTMSVIEHKNSGKYHSMYFSNIEKLHTNYFVPERMGC